MLNQKKSEGYSQSTVSSLRWVLSKGLTMAVDLYEYIEKNPMSHVKMPRFDAVKTKGDLKLITLDEFKQIIERFPRGSTYYVPVQIAFNTGLRAAEVCGLTWNCIDLKSKTILVEKNLNSEGKGKHEFGPTKTVGSYRTIDISNELVAILKTQKLDQKRNQLKYGKFYTNNRFICTQENGQPVTTDTLKYLSRIVNHKLGIKFKFHSLRHTHASRLNAEGANMIAIRDRLGQTRLSTTTDTYSHTTEELRETTNQILEELSVKAK